MTETSAASKNPSCPYCGLTHISGCVCPFVRAFEYYPDGTIKRVEFRDGSPARAVDYDIPGPRVPFKGGIAY